MAERSWKQRWLDPTLLGRQVWWHVVGYAVWVAALFGLTGSNGPFGGAYSTYFAFTLSVCFLVFQYVAYRLQRRVIRQAKSMNYRMCEFCGYDLRTIDEPGPCPECGRTFEVADLRDYWERKFEGRD